MATGSKALDLSWDIILGFVGVERTPYIGWELVVAAASPCEAAACIISATCCSICCWWVVIDSHSCYCLWCCCACESVSHFKSRFTSIVLPCSAGKGEKVVFCFVRFFSSLLCKGGPQKHTKIPLLVPPVIDSRWHLLVLSC